MSKTQLSPQVEECLCFAMFNQWERFFFLHLEFEKILSRFNAEERNQRPLFQNDDSALELYNMRLKHYQSCAHYVINADQSIQAITQEILEKL